MEAGEIKLAYLVTAGKTPRVSNRKDCLVVVAGNRKSLDGVVALLNRDDTQYELGVGVDSAGIYRDGDVCSLARPILARHHKIVLKSKLELLGYIFQEIELPNTERDVDFMSAAIGYAEKELLARQKTY